MKLLRIAALLALPPRAVDARAAAACASLRPRSYDTGATTAPARASVSVDGAPWIQLDLSGTVLAPGATLVLTARDMVQELDAAGLANSNGRSAVFDGAGVAIELAPGDGASPSRAAVPAVRVGLCEGARALRGNLFRGGGRGEDGGGGIAFSICGADDRAPSRDLRAGRLEGCTGFLVGEDVFVTAGHCTLDAASRMHFTFGAESADPSDQYAIDFDAFVRRNDTGLGNDWAAGRLLPNAVTGLKAGVAQSSKCGAEGCGWYAIGAVPTRSSGIRARVTGYGSPAPRDQKTHVGDLTDVEDTYVRYTADTRGGNSGSPVIHEETGNVIAIHTDGGCDEDSDGTDDGGTNKGTRLDRPGLAEYLASLLGATTLCAPVLGLVAPGEVCASSRTACEATAELGANGRESCDAWCARAGAACVGAWDDGSNECEKRGAIGCGETGKVRSICRCEADAPPPSAPPTPEATQPPTSPPPTPPPTPEATPPPTPQPTPEATPPPTPLPTPEATPPPTPQSTPGPTGSSTPGPSNDPTEKPTRNPTPQPTQSPTPRPTSAPSDNPTANPTRRSTNACAPLLDLVFGDEVCVNDDAACEATANLGANGRESCADWCDRAGLTCVRAWNDGRGACEKKSSLGCDARGKRASICRCEVVAPPTQGLCQPYLGRIWGGEVCSDTPGECEATADLAQNGDESCDEWCERHGLRCTSAWNDGGFCERTTEISCSDDGKRRSICLCEP